jgi:hypothetical protein
MSYAERINAFNDAIGSTQQHIENMKKTLTNGELEANPVKGGLEIAGQVTGTGTAILGLKRGLQEKGAIRQMAGAIHKAIKGKQSSGSSTADNSSGAGGDSSAGGAGDGGGTPANPPPADSGTAAADGTPAQGASGTAEGSVEAANSGAAAEGGGAAADENPFSLESFMKQLQAKGSGTVTSDGAGVDSANLPSGGAGAGDAGSDLGKNIAAAGGEDIGDASSAAAQTATGQASIAQRAQQLQLQLGSQSTQDSSGTVQGLTTSSTADTSSGQAHSLSQAQQSDADAARGQTDNPAANSKNPDSQISQGADDQANIGGRSAASGAGDEDGLSSGIKSALGAEETLDEIAPEAGPFGWLLEGFSLLATLGTSIAGAVEPSEKKKPATAPQMTGLSVGANLSQDAKNSVGAF